MIGVDLALKQLLRTPARSVLAMLLLIATLTPLLLVLGLKAGQVDPLLDAVRSDPNNLEVVLLNDKVLTEDDLATIRTLPGIGYLEPTTRSLSLRIYLSGADGNGREPASMLPSTMGDPLLADLAVPTLSNIVLSEDLARTLSIAPGDHVLASTSRFDGSPVLAADFAVSGIVPASRLSGARLLVPPAFVNEVEAYLDGYAVPRLGITGKDPGMLPAAPANARIYADRLESVSPLARALEAQGFFARVANAGIEMALSLDATARLLVASIGAALMVGAGLALWSGLSLCFLPQRRHIALLRLMGGRWITVLGYAMSLGLTISLCGIMAALGLYLVTALWLNTANASPLGLPGAEISRLSLSDMAAFAGLALALAGGVSLAFSFAYGNIHPSGALRDENS